MEKTREWWCELNKQWICIYSIYVLFTNIRLQRLLLRVPGISWLIDLLSQAIETRQSCGLLASVFGFSYFHLHPNFNKNHPIKYWAASYFWSKMKLPTTSIKRSAILRCRVDIPIYFFLQLWVCSFKIDLWVIAKIYLNVNIFAKNLNKKFKKMNTSCCHQQMNVIWCDGQKVAASWTPCSAF